MPLVQYAACHKSYPFQEKFPAIVIRNSSIISRFVSIGLHAGIQEFSSGGASRFICHKKIKNLRQRFSLGFLCPQRNFGRHIVIAQSVRVSVCPSVPLRVRCISPRFFEVGIPNLVCGYILGWRSVAYHFPVTVTLTSDLVFRIIVSGAYPLYYLRLEFQIWSVDASCDDSVAYHNWVTGTLNLTSDLVSRNCIESGAYLLYSFR